VGGLALLLGLVVTGPGSALGQGITQEQAGAILQELRAIRQLLERDQRPAAVRPPAPAGRADQKVSLAVAEAHELGRPDAPVTLVEFTDIECAFCRRFHISTFEQLKQQYVDTGKVRFVTRDLPLPIHRNALRAAHAARCAGEQGKFWELRHVMIVNASRLGPEAVRSYAQDLSLDVARLEACVESGRHEAAIRADIAAAQAAGLTGTPSFVVGRTAQDGFEGVKIVGAQPYAVFEAKIRELLNTRP
jgi:protein-disulfide isomerase